MTLILTFLLVLFAQDLRVEQVKHLWEASSRDGVEKVACLGTDTVGVPLLEPDATAGRVSAIQSLDVCAPPEWIGTIHTHLPGCRTTPMGDCVGSAIFDVLGPSDLVVAAEWARRYGVPATFCIVHAVDADATGIAVKCATVQPPPARIAP